MNAKEVEVVIIGAGAAGLMCAIEAGRRSRRVVLLDHADRPGKKILISGGGRCNFTNLHTRPENFLSENPHFAKSALSRYAPEEFIALIEAHHLPYHEKTLGQLFCDGSAQHVVTMLQKECDAAHVQTILGASISSVTKSDAFLVESSRGTWKCKSLVIATGGLSIPKMGATGFGYDLARSFGLNIIPCRPALVPFVLSAPDQQRWCDLSGLSTEAITRSRTGKQSTTFREKLLFTHRGLSGPVALQASSYWRPGNSIYIDLAPGKDLTLELRSGIAPRTPAAALIALRKAFPARLAERWLAHNPLANWTNTTLDSFEHQIHNWQITPGGTEGYTKAEVTAGGIDTAELNAKTMQANRLPGLYFIGEVVDITGWLGGYNFQWAWASGAAAGRSV